MSGPAMNRTIASCYDKGSTNIPLPKNFGRTNSLPDKFKVKYEAAEQQRKTLLVQNEKTLREFNDLERKFQLLQLQNTITHNELSEKTHQLKELSTVSQNFYKEYETLKNQYALETTALHKALEKAEQWYKENLQLKRMSMVGGTAESAAITDVVDNGEDLQGLRQSIKDLSASNAKLQTELNEAKLAEFEANEQVVNLTQELEAVQQHCSSLEKELRDLKEKSEQLVRVSKLVSEELVEVRHNEQKHRENMETFRIQADEAKKERNVLAHQSAILLQGISLEGDKIMLIQEIEELKRALEDNTNNYQRQIAELQEKLETPNPALEIAEERCKLAENDLKQAREKIEELEKLQAPPMPPPPPPAPPLPPPNLTSPTKSKLVLRKSSIKDPISIVDTPQQMAIQNGIEDIVNQIKGGQYTLKSTKHVKQKQREEPSVVSEMLNILGTLRRKKGSQNGMPK